MPHNTDIIAKNV